MSPLGRKWARLKDLRKEASLTQEELANQLGITRSALANYETGHRQPDVEAATMFAQFFKVSVDYLLERSENRTADNMPSDWKRVIATARAKGYDAEEVLRALELLEVVTNRLSAEKKPEERED